ncbi:MAG: CheR family methyltransferase [Lawsonibacter sp.]|jgi:chemotaxis protein methyltransferase CheR
MDFFHDLTISDQDFHRLVRFIQDNYGIDLSKKKTLITTRLSHSLKAQGYSNLDSFLEHLFSKKDPKDLELILNKLTTNYTYFLREKDHFTYFQNTVLPELVRRHQQDRVLAIWSAGCSSGEEPYTLSIYLKEFFASKPSSWDTRVLATDISQQALAKAKAGRYQVPADMPLDWLDRYFVRDSASGLYEVSPAIRQNVIFRPFNLMDPISFRLKFDVIFCRNVMIYFNQSTRDALVRRFWDAIQPGGYLFISHSESLGQTPLFRLVAPSVYQKK